MTTTGSAPEGADVMGSKALYAYSVSDSISLQKAIDRYQTFRSERRDGTCLAIWLAPDQLLYVFQYGTVVFVNIDPSEHQEHLDRLRMTGPHSRLRSKSEEYTEDDFVVRVVPGTTKVEFGAITIPEWDETVVYVIAQVLAQSSALWSVESEVTELLEESERFADALTSSKWVRMRRDRLLQLLAGGLTVRHQLINRVAVLSEPDSTWQSEYMDKIYCQLYKNFEIEIRLGRLEKMVELTADASQLQLEMINTRRGEFLEIVIIVLIAIEILQTLFAD